MAENFIIWIFILVELIMLLADDVQLAGTPTKLDKGVVFLKENNFLLSGDKWTVVIDFQLDEYKYVLGNMTKSLEDFKKLGDNPIFKDIITDITTARTVSNISSDIDRIGSKVDEINKILFLNEHKRNKRSSWLFNIGTIAGAIFNYGNRDSTDLERISNKIQDLKISVNEIKESVNDKFSYMLKQDKKINKTSRDLLELTKIVNSVQGTLEDLKVRISKNKQALDDINKIISKINQEYTSLNKRLIEVENTMLKLEIMKYVSDILRGISDTLKQTDNNLMEFRQAIDTTASGKLSSYFVPPKLLSDILQGIVNNLPEDLSLISSVEASQVYMYYTMAQVRAFGYDNKFRLFIDIPLKSPDRNFELYRVKGLPYLDESLPGNKVSMAIVPSHPYFAITRNRQYYVLMDDADLGKCKGDANIICPADTIVFSVNQGHCLSALFTGEPVSAIDTCDLRVIGEGRLPIWYRPSQKNSWIYSLPKKTRITEMCRNEKGSYNTTVKTLFNTGILEDTANCYIYSNSFRLMPHVTGNLYIDEEPNDIVVPEMDMNLNDGLKINSLDVLHIRQDYQESGIRLSELAEKVDQLKLAEVPESFTTLEIVLIVACALPYAAFTAYFVRKRFTNYMNSKRTSNENSDPRRLVSLL